MGDQNKNLILAVVLSSIVMLIWLVFFPPQKPIPPAPSQTAQTTGQTAGQTASGAITPPAATTPAQETAPAPISPQAKALANAPRISIDTPKLLGSISLLGGRIDDLALKGYHETLDPDSPLVTLLIPADKPKAYYTLYGWVPAGMLSAGDVPGAATLWQVETGTTLSPKSPVVLRWNNGKGLIFRRKISVDDKYMFTITQSVENNGDQAVSLAPYGMVVRQGKPKTVGTYIIFEGVVRMSDGRLEELKYSKLPKLDVIEREGSPAEIIDVKENGWTGFTNKYWMTTLIPAADHPFQSVAKYIPQAKIYQTETRGQVVSIAPGGTSTVATRLFAGAKQWQTLRFYQNKENVPGFINSIDWGWFFFLTKPIFWLLHNLNALIGNMGFAIIALTITLKALLLPLAYKSYVSMAKMKELQPEMQKIKEAAGDDRQKQQQAIMALYKREKVNPAAGCLPILLQIPIFFSLYKVIRVTIELRQAPFIGWIRDLSAPDPSSILNLFGLLPYVPPHTGILAMFSLGLFPILLGISMWLQQKLNPAPSDPTQKMIFAWMPWVFMFMLGRFASGLVLYWITNNTITFTQQYMIMRSHGHKPDVFGNIMRGFKRKTPESE